MEKATRLALSDAIPLEARILSLADAYDAMNSDRPYRPALTAPQIAEELEKGAGTQFDPVLVQMLLPMLSGQVSNVLPARILRIISDDEVALPPAMVRRLPAGLGDRALAARLAAILPRRVGLRL